MPEAAALRRKRAGYLERRFVTVDVLGLSSRFHGRVFVRRILVELMPQDFMPHGYCFLWNPLVLWLHVVSDALIASSYYCIPIVLVYFIRKNREIPFSRIFWMFGAFILACGTTHLMEIWNIWHASYLLAGAIKAVTAGVSVLTAAMLIPLVPKAITVPERIHLVEANQKLKREIAARKRFEAPLETSIRRKVTGGFLFAVLLTVVLGVSSWRGARQAEQDSYWVSHTHEVMESIQRTLRSVIEAETSARAFALSGEEALLAHYQYAHDEIYQNEDELRHLTADNASQQIRMDELQSRVGTALQFADSIIAKRRARGVDRNADYDALEIERRIDAVRATTRAMYSEESRLLAERGARIEAGQQWARDVALLGVLLGVILWTLARLAVNREIAVSERARTQLSILNGELERRVEERTAALRLEIAERERTAEARERLAAVVDSSDDAIISKTLQGVITSWNRGAEKVFGYLPAEAIGQPFRMLIPPERAQEETDILARIGRGESVDHFETERLRKDGSRIYVSATISPMRDKNGRIVGASKIARDISPQKRAEQALKESLATSEAALRELADQKFALDQHAIVATTDVQGTITYVNDKFCTISKYSREELLGQNHRILNSGHHPKEFFHQMYATIANGKVWHGEIKNRAKDGSTYWVDTTIVPSMNAEGKPSQYVAIRADITERKHAEQALKESLATSEAALRDLADQKFALDQHAIVATTDVQGTITYVNDKFCTISKYSREELLGQNHRILNSGHHPAEFFKEMYHVIGGGRVWRGEIKNRAKDGSIYWVDTTIVPFMNAQGKPRQYAAIRADITERKWAEASLALQTEELAMRSSELADQAKVLDLAQVMVRDLKGCILLWNLGAEKLYGFTRQEAVGRTSHELLQTEFPEALGQIEAKLMRDGSWEGELVHRRRDNTEIVVSSLWVLHRDNQGTPTRVLEANVDITARKQAERQLAGQAEELARQAEELLRSREALESQKLLLQSVLDSISEGLVAVDESGKFVMWNPAAGRIVGLGPENLATDQWGPHYGVFMSDKVTPFPTQENPLVRAMKGEASTVEMFLRNPEREEGTWIEINGSPLRGKDGVVRGGVVAFRDITQRVMDEQKIRQWNDELEQRVRTRTAQLEAVNKELETFSYSVSHDLRAPLRHMSGFSKILSEDFGPSLPAEAQRHLQRIEDGAKRMGQLVDELLNLTRVGRQTLAVQATDLSAVVKDVITMLEPETQGRQVEWKISELPAMACDGVLIRQVFQNLIGNALKYSRQRSPAVIEIGQSVKDGQSVIFVKDNGVGFNMKYADKLFGVFQRLHRAEEFEGTGVGLATVRRIVQKHGGQVWAEAEVDRGSTFYFTLSGAGQPAPKVAAATAGGQP